MKSSLKKRIAELKGSFNSNSRQRCAKVVYDASSGFDPSSLEIETLMQCFAYLIMEE